MLSSPLLQKWLPSADEVSHKRILISAFAALCAIGLVAAASRLSLPGWDAPFIVASMGASSVLLFVLPSSPMSQPWPFAGGHLVSAFMGVASAKLFGDPALAAACAVSGAILAMHLSRCMHPPGGAVALLAVVGGDAVHRLGFWFVLSPVALNVSLMLGCFLAYWYFLLRPQQAGRPQLERDLQRGEEAWLSSEPPFTDQDLGQAISDMDTLLDITHRDLMEIYARALQLTHKRQLASLRCSDLMSQPVIRAEFATELAEAWGLMQSHAIRGLPIVNRGGQVIGMATVRDFIHHANQLNHPSLEERLAQLCSRCPNLESEKPEVVGQIMSNPVYTAFDDQPVEEIITLFSEHCIHHLPVINRARKLVGMLTREDIMAAFDRPQP